MKLIELNKAWCVDAEEGFFPANLRGEIFPVHGGRGVAMGLISMLVMQVCVLLFALGMFWLTFLVSRSALMESLEDLARICVLLGKADRK